MRRNLAVFVALLAALMLVAAGCAKKAGAPSSGKAKEIIQKASLNMQKIKTVRSNGTYKMRASKGGAQSMDINYEMETDISDPANPNMRMVMKGGGQDVDMYVTGGYGYVNVAGKGWLKAPYKAEDITKRTSPAEIAKFAKNAEDFQILKEDARSYIIRFKLGRKFIESQLKSREGEQSGETQKYLEKVLKSMKMSCLFTVSKADHLIERAEIAMEMKDFPAVGDVTFEMVMNFRDFNKPIAIELPEEAKKAQETQSLPFQGLPGFGF